MPAMQAFITTSERDIIWYAHTRLALCLVPPVPPSAQVMLETEFRRLRSPCSPSFLGLPPVLRSSAQVDALLTRLEETRRELRTARNAFLPVSHIPVEMLSTIFEYLLDPDPSTFSVPRTKDLRTVSQICRHWRDTSLSCSLLWRWPQVAGVHPEWTKLMLNRSGRASIFLRAQLYAPSAHVVEACRLVLTQVHRLGEIHLSGDGLSISMLLNFVSYSAPRLRSLIVSNSGWKAESDAPTLGWSFLQGGAPVLERLELRKCALPWNAPLLLSCPELQSLVVDGLGSNRASLSQFLGILKNTPHLKVLHMEHVVPTSYASTSLGEIDNTPLQGLQELYLSGPTSDITALLTHVTFPRSTSLSLRCTCNDKPDELPSLAGALCSRLAASCSTFPLRALHISLDAVQITMHAKATEHIVENESLWDLAEEGALSVTLVAGPDTLHTPAAVETLVSAFALQDIGALLLDDYEGFLDEPLVCHLLRRTPNLRLVHARHDAASPVVSALLSDATARGPDDPEVLPRLEVLVLEEVDMNWAFDSTPFVHMLQEAQFLRCLRRSPIDELRVKRCMNVGPNDIRTLCHLFTDVHWDSFEAYVTDAESDQEADEVWPDENIWADYWEYEGVEWHS